MIHFKNFHSCLIIFFILVSCSSIPKNTKNSCAIFEERYLWYKHTKASYEKWGAPIHLQLAFIKKETNNKYATRARFKDSVDFIGWYINKTSKILKISKKDAYRQYLAYYKGWGDYKNYRKDKKAIIYAKTVRNSANIYRKQLTMCQKNLNKNKYVIF